MIKRRRVLLLDPKFQLKFSFYVCSWIMVLSLIFPAVIYNLFEWLVKFAKTHLTPDSAAMLGELQSEVLWNLILMEITYMGLILLISLFVSHRIAGPIYKLKKYFLGVRDGNLLKDLQFRKNDHFQDLAKDYNEMVAGIRNRIHESIESVSTAIARIENALPQASGDNRKELEAALTDLRKVRDKMSL